MPALPPQVLSLAGDIIRGDYLGHFRKFLFFWVSPHAQKVCMVIIIPFVVVVVVVVVNLLLLLLGCLNYEHRLEKKTIFLRYSLVI